jgi:O-antigen ligase
MTIFKKENYVIILLLLPLSFIVGIAITELLVLISIIFFIFFNKDKLIFLDLKIIFLFLFSIYIFFNALIQISDDLKISSLFYFRFIIFSLSIFYLCKILETSPKKKYFIFFILPLIILILDSLFQFFKGVNFLGFQVYNDRVSSFFGDELILGSFLVRLLPITLWFFLYFNIDVKKYTILNIVFFSLYLITIYLSGERTSFILMLMLIFLITIFIKIFRKIFSISFFMLILFILLTIFLNIGSTNPSNRIFVKTFNQLTDNKLNKNTKKKYDINLKNISNNIKFYSTDHQGHIILALKLFKENKIFGKGPKGFRHYCRSINYNSNIGICSTHPHNTIIQIISELGLIGLAFYVIAALFIIIKFFQSTLRKNYNNNFLSFYVITFGLVINLFPFIPSGNFFNNWISIIIYYNVGLYLFSYKKIYF